MNDRSGVRTELCACAAAITFLSRLPLWRLVPHDLSDLPRAATYFPVVGLIVGGLGWLVFAAAAHFWPPALAVILSVAATVWITGAFHEDALADALDGFGGGWEKQQILTIMKDSRVGSYALIGMILVVAAKVVALTTLAGDGTAVDLRTVAAALVAAHVLGRWSSVPLIWRLPYVRPEEPGARPSAGRPFVAGVTRARVVTSTLLTALLVGTALHVRAIPATAACLLVMWIGARYVTRRIGGITGDALGAINQLVELAVYLVLAAHVRA